MDGYDPAKQDTALFYYLVFSLAHTGDPTGGLHLGWIILLILAIKMAASGLFLLLVSGRLSTFTFTVR